ncbi:MAG: YggS family pyridoxal phosphate-dependent enzyme [Muribaculaceae bacterium]|nr:YggS family pyridoxal phosphate-dependent enzyme [Muribaculaceae bacterium]
MTSSVASRIASLSRRLPGGVTLVAVSKFHPVEAIAEAYAAGQRVFGESRAQELALKVPALPADIEWHFIGHLQSNKVKAVVPLVHTIQSVDSLKLLRAIDDEARKTGKVVNVLLQVHVAAEETKFGFSPEELAGIAAEAAAMTGARVTGVMGMASNTDDAGRIAADFAAIKSCFDALAAGAFAGRHHFATVSMGMSGDWPLAVDHGSNMVRIGSDIFGERQYF